ncbi:NAD(P)-dependent oxidoreductase, partial [Ellagibacter isourolithinifaciens]|uniref:NAD(P)-dependent oxidoreductase n=1 Tax=Ellagibacter isourolithinifaciens TaxID=2137581 RepID=UPI003AAA4177
MPMVSGVFGRCTVMKSARASTSSTRSKFLGKELYEKTLAIFGLGRIGGLVAERA